MDLVTLVPILLIIRDQIDERHEIIGNWLYCLRNQDPDNARKDKAVVPVKDDGASPSKRRRSEIDEHRRKKRASHKSGEFTNDTIHDTKKSVFSLYNTSLNVDEGLHLDRSYVEEWASQNRTLGLID